MSSVGAFNFVKMGQLHIFQQIVQLRNSKLTQQHNLLFQFPSKNKNAFFKVSIDGGATHIFDISFATNMPGESGSWKDIEEISDV